MPSTCSYMRPLAWLKYVFGDALPLKRSVGISAVAKINTGRYRLTLNTRSESGLALTDDGVAMSTIAGPHLIAADFVDESTIEVQIRSCTTGALLDPPNGTRIVILVLS